MSSIPTWFKVDRKAERGIHKLGEIFKGLEHSHVFTRMFSSKVRAAHFLKNVSLRVEEEYGYMYVDPTSGYVIVSKQYLLEGDMEDLYLDIIHELVHVKQWLNGSNLYDGRYRYVERPTELEAYTVVVEEARRIGMSRGQIIDYLSVPWISDRELQLLADKLGVKA